MSDIERPEPTDEDRPVLEYEEALPEHLTDDVEAPEADTLDQHLEVELDDDDER